MSKIFRSFGIVGLAFAILFTTLGAGQYLFLRHQLSEETTQMLSESAEQVRDQIQASETWHLEGYRRTSAGPATYILMADNGTVVDVGDFLPGMLSRVSIPFPIDRERVVRFESDVGERWSLYLHGLRDGVVVLGVRTEAAPDRLEEIFAQNAARFGTSVADAVHTPERAIHESLDYAILDTNQVVRWDNGGIPFRAPAPVIPAKPRLTGLVRVGEKSYSALLYPLRTGAGRAVGMISIFADVTGDERVLHQSLVFNIVVAAMLWLITSGLGIVYIRRIAPDEIACSRVLSLNESDTIEFKSSFRWDYSTQKPNRDLEKAVVKTIAGFLNSDRGGTLIIGISDTKEVLGLEGDYSLIKTRKDRDGFEQTLGQALINAIGERLFARCVKVRFCAHSGKEMCLVTVIPAREPVYVQEEKGAETLYVRTGNTTRPLNTKDAVAYATEHWGGLTLRWLALTRRAPVAVRAS